MNASSEVDRVIDGHLNQRLDASGIDLEALADMAAAKVASKLPRRQETRGFPNRRRVFAVAIVAFSVSLASGVAVSASLGVFPGISLFDRSTAEPSREIGADVDVLEQAVDEMPPKFGEIGQLLPESRRVALRDTFEDFQVEIVLSRTTKQNICISTTYRIRPAARGGGGGCFPSLDGNLTFESGYHGRDVVYGIIPDGVSGVEVKTIAGSEQSALIGDNVFFWAAPDKTTRFKSLRQVTAVDS